MAGEDAAFVRVVLLADKERAEARRLCESIRRHLAEGGDGDVDLVEEDVGALEHLLGVDEGSAVRPSLIYQLRQPSRAHLRLIKGGRIELPERRSAMPAAVLLGLVAGAAVITALGVLARFLSH